MNLKTKVGDLWGLQNFKLVPMGVAHYHVILNYMEEQYTVMSWGLINLSPGLFRVAR